MLVTGAPGKLPITLYRRLVLLLLLVVVVALLLLFAGTSGVGDAAVGDDADAFD